MVIWDYEHIIDECLGHIEVELRAAVFEFIFIVCFTASVDEDDDGAELSAEEVVDSSAYSDAVDADFSGLVELDELFGPVDDFECIFGVKCTELFDSPALTDAAYG